MSTKICQNIICAFHLKCQVIVLFLHFFITDIAWSVIRYCCCLDDNILFTGTSCHFLEHFPRCCDRNYIYKMWFFYRSRSGNKRNVCSALHTYLRNRITHLSGRMICNIPDRIHRLLCRTCCNQDSQPFHILLSGNLPQNVFKQELRFRHFSCSCISTCKIPDRRTDHFIVIVLQCLQIILNDWIFEHIRIHCRCNNLLTLACHDRCRQHVIRNPMCDLSDHIRTCRCKHEYVCFLRQ